jgi:hypothetical protein
VFPIEDLDLLVSGAAVAGQREAERVFARSVAVAGLAFVFFGRGRLEDGRDQLPELGRGRNPVAGLGIARRQPDLFGRIEARQFAFFPPPIERANRVDDRGDSRAGELLGPGGASVDHRLDFGSRDPHESTASDLV